MRSSTTSSPAAPPKRWLGVLSKEQALGRRERCARLRCPAAIGVLWVVDR